MPLLIHEMVGNIEDPDIIALVRELENATGRRASSEEQLLQFLQNCHHPLGTDKWYRIEKSRIIPGGLLSRKIGKLKSAAVAEVCSEIATKFAGLSLEAVEGVSLYQFFNKHTPHLFKPTRRKPFDPRDGLRRMGF